MARAALLCSAALVTVSALSSAAASAPAEPAPDARVAPESPRRLNVLGLTRGPDARIVRLQDSVITTASGTRIRFRVPGTDRHQALLGRSGNRWLVIGGQVSTSQFTVSAVRRGHDPVTVPKLGGYAANGDVYSNWMLSRDGDMVVRTSYDRGGEYASARAIDGTLLGELYDADQPLDVAEGRIILRASNDDGQTRVFDWRPGEETLTPLARAATGASVEHDLLWVRTTGIESGPTSMAAPATPAWSAPFAPLDVSPSGELVAGLRVNRLWYDDPAVLEVRRVSDGTLLDAISFGPTITKANRGSIDRHEQTMRWESDSQLVFEMRTRRGSTLVRCRPGGRCTRASDFGGRISVPYEQFTWPLPE